MIIPGQFGFNCPSGFKAKLYMNVHWMILYKLYFFCSDMKFKMAATAGFNLILDPIVQVVSEKKRFETFSP
jgi:hypothetical protein